MYNNVDQECQQGNDTFHWFLSVQDNTHVDRLHFYGRYRNRFRSPECSSLMNCEKVVNHTLSFV